MYKDGGTAVTGNKSNDSTSTSSPAHVFSLGGGLGNDFKGNFDEVSVWNRVLTSGEVASLRNSGSGIVTTTLADLSDLKAYWNLNATSGTYENNFAKSLLPENTLFEETDTRFVYFLQNNVWENSKQPLNMTFADQTAADAVWIPDSQNYHRIDVTNKYLLDNFDSTTGSFIQAQCTYDLGSNLDTTWTVQFTFRASNYRSPTSSNYTWMFGMFGANYNSNANTTQDRLAIVYDTTNHFQSTGANASGDGSMTTMPATNPTLSSSTNSTEYFVTLQKTGTTGYKVVLRTGSHSGTILSTHSPTWQSGTPSVFRYFGMKSRMSNSARLGAIIKDVLVYDGALVG